MYNAGFGDCLLLTFHTSDGKPRYMLIDCGVHPQYPEGREIMRKVANNIVQATGNHLHVVAITHEHADHLYGFRYARDIFKDIVIDDLWLAWTEDPNDPVAKQLKNGIKKGIDELKLSINKLTAMNKQMADQLQHIIEFELLAEVGGSKESELDFLRKRSKRKLGESSDYLKPGGKALSIPGVDGINIFVMGPPRDIAYIKTVERESEMYPELSVINPAQAFFSALNGKQGRLYDEAGIIRSCPFDEKYEISSEKAKTDQLYGDFFRKYYGFSEETGQGAEWRRIDADWLAPSEELALKINSMTNNTSLVLAIELYGTEPKKVLLFTGDAQVGNWLSWHDLSFTQREGTEEITGEDLLRRTALLKCAHHGSRNATLKEKGLEMMDSACLATMIPVDQKWANDEMHWEHPAEKLLERIQEKTRGKVLRTDTIHAMPGILKKPHNCDASIWQAFINHLDWDHSPDNLWIEYTIK